MDRFYYVFWRLLFLILFILGFIGAAASGADHDESGRPTESPVASLIRDVRIAEEVNEINEGRWNQDVSDLRQDGLARVENLLDSQKVAGDSSDTDEIGVTLSPGAPPLEPPNSPEDFTTRAKSELAE